MELKVDEENLTFIDLIKGVVPFEISNFLGEILE